MSCMNCISCISCELHKLYAVLCILYENLYTKYVYKHVLDAQGDPLNPPACGTFLSNVSHVIICHVMLTLFKLISFEVLATNHL
jgi:hypothetical protein